MCRMPQGRGDVAIGELLVRLTDDGSVGRDHGCSITRNLVLMWFRYERCSRAATLTALESGRCFDQTLMTRQKIADTL